MSTIADLVVRVNALAGHVTQALADAHAAGVAEGTAAVQADVDTMDTAVGAAETALGVTAPAPDAPPAS